MSGRRLLTATTLVALAMSLPTPAGATVDLGGCRSVIHHGMNPSWGEESIYSTEQATRWGFGGEVDARITADKRLGSGHDPTARRVSGGTETRRWSDMTLAEAKAVNLVKGGHPASTAEMVRAAARTTGGRLMITVNGYAEFGEDWRVWGFDALWSVVTNNAMEGRVIVGGFGVIPYLHEHFPDMRTFERQEFDEVRTPEYFIDRGVDLVGVPSTQLNRAYVDALRAAGLVVGSRMITTKDRWRGAYDAGIRLFQVDWNGVTDASPADIVTWCRARR